LKGGLFSPGRQAEAKQSTRGPVSLFVCLFVRLHISWFRRSWKLKLWWNVVWVHTTLHAKFEKNPSRFWVPRGNQFCSISRVLEGVWSWNLGQVCNRLRRTSPEWFRHDRVTVACCVLYSGHRKVQISWLFEGLGHWNLAGICNRPRRTSSMWFRHDRVTVACCVLYSGHRKVRISWLFEGLGNWNLAGICNRPRRTSSEWLRHDRVTVACCVLYSGHRKVQISRLFEGLGNWNLAGTCNQPRRTSSEWFWHNRVTVACCVLCTVADTEKLFSTFLEEFEAETPTVVIWSGYVSGLYILKVSL